MVQVARAYKLVHQCGPHGINFLGTGAFLSMVDCIWRRIARGVSGPFFRFGEPGYQHSMSALQKGSQDKYALDMWVQRVPE